MIQRVLIIGGYGNFGRYIAKTLAQEPALQIIIAGRSAEKANAFIATIESANPLEAARLDIEDDLSSALIALSPNIVIHTSGPFQSQSYDVAKCCIEQGCHYIDLADGRDFVAGITALHTAASNQGVLVISGASSVPCLTAALVDHYQDEFQTLESLDYGISTAQKTTRGLATTAAILGYTGKAFPTLINGRQQLVVGWQGLHSRYYASLGRRLLGNCDVPDLALFPERYPSLQTIRFYAGLELPFVHITLWALSWLVRIGLVKSLQPAAALMLRASFLFDALGSTNSAFHMVLSGKDKQGTDKTITFELIARDGDGPYIPCMPAILLTKKLANNDIAQTGAYPCMGFISKDEYLDALSHLAISWHVA